MVKLKSYNKALSLVVAESHSTYNRIKVTQSLDAVNFIKQLYSSDIEIVESFYLLCLNRANNTIAHVRIS